MLARAEAGARPPRRKPAMEPCVGQRLPEHRVLTRDEFRAEQESQVNQFLTVLVAILALSEIIAILGIINTLALSVFERTRELGLLRVVGMSRRQIRGMVRGESVVIAVIGGVVGLALGICCGAGRSRTALQSQGLTVFRIPVLEVLLFLAGSMLAGVLAAVLPGVAGGATRRARGDRDRIVAPERRGAIASMTPLTGRLAQG